MLIWSQPGGASLVADRGIVRAHEYGAVVQFDELLGSACEEAISLRMNAEAQAARIVGQAELQARRMLQEARTEVAQLQEEARQAADDEAARGYAEGLREGAAEWHERFAQLQAGQAAAQAGMEDRLAGIVALVVDRIVSGAPREALFARSLQGVRAALGESTGARLRVHPGDVRAAEAAVAADTAARGGPRVQVEADASLQPGACLFESSLGRLDASLDVQLAGMRAALERATRMAIAGGGQAAAAAAAADGAADMTDEQSFEDEEAIDG
jgi:type III secretion protein L